MSICLGANGPGPAVATPPHVRTQQRGRLGGGCPPPAGPVSLGTSSCPQCPGKTSPAGSLPASSSAVTHRARAARSEQAATSWYTRPQAGGLSALFYKQTTCSRSQSRTASPGLGARPRACCAHSLLPLPSCFQRGPSGLTAQPLADSPGASGGWLLAHLQTAGLSETPGSWQL